MLNQHINRARAQLRAFLRSRFVRDTITLQIGKTTLVGINVVASVILLRGLGPEGFGTWALVLNIFNLLLTLNLTGLGLSTLTRLSESISANDYAETRNLLGFFVQMSLLVAVVSCGVAFAAAPAFAELSFGNAHIGELARLYALVLFLLPVYQLMLLVLQSARSMRAYAILENGSVLLDALLTVGAVLIGAGVEGVVAAYLLSALVKAAGSLYAYRWLQRRRPARFPPVSEITHTARTISPRRYWGFGVRLAIDKNIANLFIQLPQTFVGAWHGEAAAGFLKLALSGLARPSMIFSGILANLGARIPADVGRADYARLRTNMRKVVIWVVPLSVGLFGAFALAAPLVVPILIGEEYIPVIPLIAVLSVYGALTGIGGIFGPLYRALRLMRAIIAVKVATLLLAALPGLWLMSQFGALGGAWAINLIFALSVGLTAAVTWPHLRRLAAQQETEAVEAQPSTAVEVP